MGIALLSRNTELYWAGSLKCISGNTNCTIKAKFCKFSHRIIFEWIASYINSLATYVVIHTVYMYIYDLLGTEEKPTISQPEMENNFSHKNYGQQLQMTQTSSLRPSQFSYQYNGHIQESKQQQQLHHQHPTGRYPNGLVQASPTPQYVPRQPSIPTDDPHKNFHSSHMQENNYACNHSKSQYHPRPVQNKVSAANGNLPDSKIPANSPILLKLSQEVREWKFLGRYLDLEEETIDEIDYNTVPNKTREKALKVFTEWVNSSTPTWAVLGEALLDANYIMLYEKLLELIRGY